MTAAPARPRRRALALLAPALLAGGAALGAAAPRPAVRFEGGWSRPVPAGLSIGVGYGVLVNDGARPVRLTALASPVAAAVELHETMRMNGPMGAMSHMAALPALEVPAHGRVDLAPNGRHMMLIGLKHPLRRGDAVPVTLTFAGAPPLHAELQVRPSSP